MHGKDTTIPKGTEITAYVNGNMPLDLAKFAPVAPPYQRVAASSAVAPQNTPANAELQSPRTRREARSQLTAILSDTPSELVVAAGLHTITIVKHGYKPWERKLPSRVERSRSG